MTELDADLQMQPIQAASVVSQAYERIRALILNGEVAPGTRLGQVELAERLGISRTPVREALRRLTGEGLVEFQDNRGFRVAELHLDDVLNRLEVRLLLEPGAARLAAERATEADLADLQACVEREAAARTAVDVHDASREFHVGVARATQNRELVTTIENLWLIEVGRRLLAQRRAAPHWQDGDVAEHRAILAAIAARDGDRAAALMERHVRDALRHWEPARERAQ
ncbi:MAG: GntR family transcriptional regulator [Solirubrobacteraceae bacterium]|nr:GntR family transcriptional regulator [Solirubrobacteraceae bacterium]